MQDIQLDTNGEFRCPNCGGKNFSEKRTRRAKVIGVTAGVATVGLAGAAAPLIAKKRLHCLACGTYSRAGNAQPFRATPTSGAKTTSAANRNTVNKKPATKAEEDAGLWLMAAIAVCLFVWAIVAGSILWSIVTGLFLAFCAFGVVEMLKSSKKSAPKSNRPSSKSR